MSHVINFLLAGQLVSPLPVSGDAIYLRVDNVHGVVLVPWSFQPRRVTRFADKGRLRITAAEGIPLLLGCVHQNRVTFRTVWPGVLCLTGHVTPAPDDIEEMVFLIIQHSRLDWPPMVLKNHDEENAEPAEHSGAHDVKQPERKR